MRLEQLIMEYQKRADFINNPIINSDETLVRLQKELFQFLITKLENELEVEQGEILQNERNELIISDFSKETELFKEQFTTSIYKKICENMLIQTDLLSSYFRESNSRNTISNIQDKIFNITAIIGIDPSGKVIKGSYIDKLTDSEALKFKLVDYIRISIDSQQDFMSFRNGMAEIVEESENVNEVNRDIWEFAHDVFFVQSQQQDNFFADFLGLDFFIYDGTKLTTSRPFCCGGFDKVANQELPNKISKVFSRKDAEKFDKMDWEGKIPGVKFFAQIGGYGCRHHLSWITKEKALKMGYKIDS